MEERIDEININIVDICVYNCVGKYIYIGAGYMSHVRGMYIPDSRKT